MFRQNVATSNKRREVSFFSKNYKSNILRQAKVKLFFILPLARLEWINTRTSRNSLHETDTIFEIQVTAVGLEPTTTYFVNELVYKLSDFRFEPRYSH